MRDFGYLILVLLLCNLAQLKGNVAVKRSENDVNACVGIRRTEKNRLGFWMNHTLYGEPNRRPVIIINTLTRGAAEWQGFIKMLCDANLFSPVLVNVPVVPNKLYWKILLMIHEARSSVQSKAPAIIFAKRTGAIYATKYAIKFGFDSISKIGLVSPNITDLGDIWTLNKMKGHLCLFWNTEDPQMNYFEAATVWESTILPPMITVRDTKRALSPLLFRSMFRFATYDFIMQTNYSSLYEGDMVDHNQEEELGPEDNR